MAMPIEGDIVDVFIIRLIKGVVESDASISLVSVTVDPLGSGSQFHFVQIDFIYETGDPPATRFSVTWQSDILNAELPSNPIFFPQAPEGVGDDVRVGRVTVTVPSPNIRTTFTGRITVHQE